MDSKITEFLANPPKHINPPILTVARGIHFNTWLQQNPVRATKKKNGFQVRWPPKALAAHLSTLSDVALEVLLQCGRATPPVEADVNEGREDKPLVSGLCKVLKPQIASRMNYLASFVLKAVIFSLGTGCK